MTSIAFEKAQSHCHVEKAQELGKTGEEKPIRRPCDSPDERGWWFGPTLLQSGQRQASRCPRYACGGLTTEAVSQMAVISWEGPAGGG